jgi:hypothetical protein
MSDTDYPSSSPSSHSSRRLDSSSLQSSESTDTLLMSRSPLSSRHGSSMSSWSPSRSISNSNNCPPSQTTSPVPFNPASPVALSLGPPSPTQHSQLPSPLWLLADLQFGKCVMPDSLPTSPVPGGLVNEIKTSDKDSSSSSEDEEVEAKRLKVDPD